MKKVIYFLLAIVLLQTTACKKETNGNTTTVTTVPVTPSGLTAQLSSVTKVNLTWTDNSTNEDGFKIERKTNNTNYVQIGSTATNVTSFIDTTLQFNTQYTYRIYAYNTVGNSPTYSNEVTVNTIGLPVIDTSTLWFYNYINNITGSSAKYQAHITSNGNSPITAYGVVWSKNPNPTIGLSTKTNNGFNNGAYFSFLDELTNLDANTTYYAKVYATNDAGTSYGKEIVFKTIDNIYVVGLNLVNPNIGYWIDEKYVNLNFPNTTGGSLSSTYVNGNDVYFAGVTSTGIGFNMPILIKNGIMTQLPLPTGIISYPFSVFVNGNDVYVAGGNPLPGGGNACIWKNGSYTQLSNNNSTNTLATSVYVSGSDVYVAGYEDNYATIWKNGIKTQLSTNTGSKANSVYVSGSDVYIVGVDNNFATIWKNGVKTQLSANSGSKANSVYVSGSDIYVAGMDNNYAALWKNGLVDLLTIVFPGPGGCANSVYVSGSDVYVAGYDNDSNGKYYATIWKNGSGSAIRLSNNQSQALSVYGKH